MQTNRSESSRVRGCSRWINQGWLDLPQARCSLGRAYGWDEAFATIFSGVFLGGSDQIVTALPGPKLPEFVFLYVGAAQALATRRGGLFLDSPGMTKAAGMKSWESGPRNHH